MDELLQRIGSGRYPRVAHPADIRALSPDTEVVFVLHLDDQAARELSRFHHLRAVLQGGSPLISDSGVAHLARAASLEWLDLEWAEHITDRSLEALTRANHLRYLDLSFCPHVTDEGIGTLRARNPGLVIQREPDPLMAH
jgi:hypothetical protein